MDTSTFLYVIFIYLQMYNPNHIMKKVKLLLLILVSVCSIVMKGQQKEAATNESSSTQPMPYPADYAGDRIRFHALFIWDPAAESAHVEFDQQALRFFHKLSYGEGFTYDVRTACPNSLDSLKKYDVVVMLNSLPQEQDARTAFEQYMEQGGGWIGFHATGYNDKDTHWPWFNKFLGCGTFLCNNWPPQPALVDIENSQHPITRNLPSQFVVPASEFYQFSPSPRANKDVEVLLSISSKNYPFGIKDIVLFGDFPIVWTNKLYRMVYINMGHGDECFIDATQSLLFTNAFRWVALECKKSIAKSAYHGDTKQTFAKVEQQLRYQLEQVNKIRKERNDWSLMPRSVEKDGSLRMVHQPDWCCGFFSGELWQMYQYSHDDFWRSQAASNTWPIEQVKLDAGSHDLGFMVFNSFGKAWRETGERSYRDVVVEAANSLISRYDEMVGCIRSWSWGTPERWQYAVIIDNMMNLELLFEASKITGDKRYYDIAVNHANKTMKHHFRPDNSCYHVVDYNPTDGSVIKRITHQGLFDESVWSRGQAWALYGFTMCYRYTHNKAYLEQAQKIASFWLSQPNMPDDLIPYWDMRDPAIKTDIGPAQDGTCPRDASAAAITASALYELATYVGADDAATYHHFADKTVHSLETKYMANPQSAQGFLLLHSTGNYPGNDEIDVPINYADYYYLEALLRREMSRM